MVELLAPLGIATDVRTITIESLVHDEHVNDDKNSKLTDRFHRNWKTASSWYHVLLGFIITVFITQTTNFNQIKANAGCALNINSLMSGSNNMSYILKQTCS